MVGLSSKKRLSPLWPMKVVDEQPQVRIGQTGYGREWDQ